MKRIGDGKDMILYQFPDYETYRQVQEEGNKAKIGRQFVRESHIVRLANILKERGKTISFGLCHGTRSGREQAWFAKHLEQGEVIGTEISETATQFPNTVQWDFHDENPDWNGKADFVYSNSWDHAFDPHRAFTSWFNQLKLGGVLMLDHTDKQSPSSSNILDPFGASVPKLVEILKEVTGERARIEVLDFTKAKGYHPSVVVVERIA